MNKFNFYFDPPSSASFSGLNTIKNEKKNFKEPEIKNWLLNQEPYTLHRPIIKKFKRQKTIVAGINDLWQMDLVDVSKISKQNKGFNFLLTVIDVFSKRAWIEPIKNKSSESILNALKKIFKDSKPKKVQTDNGTEFKNRIVQKYLKDNNIEFYTTFSELKASVVERFNRTIKEKMWRYFTYKQHNVYTNVLQDLVDSYNNTYHRTIKTKPMLVTPKNESEVWKNIYGYDRNTGDDSVINPKLTKNDKVRLSKSKGIFEKGYTPNWTREIFVIDKVLYQNPHAYKIKDLADEIVEGKFYEQELQKIEEKEEIYSIDKILRKRKRNNQTEYFVSWLGYPKSFNSWINAKDLIGK